MKQSMVLIARHFLVRLIKLKQSVLKLFLVKPQIFYSDLDEKDLKPTNQKVYKHLVGIEGMGLSGSSAVTDFLAEFSNTTVIGGVDMSENPARGVENNYEFDFLRAPGGVLDLERICYSNCPRVIDNAIHEFIATCNSFYNSSIPLFSNTYFLALSKKFIKEVVSYAFFDSPMHISYYKKDIALAEFRRLIHEYLINLFKSIPSNEYLAVDCLTAIGFPSDKTLSAYLGEYKVIRNRCDPRDVYARARMSPGNDWVPVDPDIFVMHFLQNHAPWIDKPDKNSIITSFENLCTDYERESQRIMNFLGITQKSHIDRFKYFDPRISINNTGCYRKLDNQAPIDYIFARLKNYCWDSEKHRYYGINYA